MRHKDTKIHLIISLYRRQLQKKCHLSAAIKNFNSTQNRSWILSITSNNKNTPRPGNKGNLNLLYEVVSKSIPWPLGAFDNRRSFTSIAVSYTHLRAHETDSYLV